VLNVPLEAFAGWLGTLITSHVANVPRRRPERPSGMLCRGLGPTYGASYGEHQRKATLAGGPDGYYT
jgi:hypothetical protein